MDPCKCIQRLHFTHPPSPHITPSAVPHQLERQAYEQMREELLHNGCFAALFYKGVDTHQKNLGFFNLQSVASWNKGYGSFWICSYLELCQLLLFLCKICFEINSVEFSIGFPNPSLTCFPLSFIIIPLHQSKLQGINHGSKIMIIIQYLLSKSWPCEFGIDRLQGKSKYQVLCK